MQTHISPYLPHISPYLPTGAERAAQGGRQGGRRRRRRVRLGSRSAFGRAAAAAHEPAAGQPARSDAARDRRRHSKGAARGKQVCAARGGRRQRRADADGAADAAAARLGAGDQRLPADGAVQVTSRETIQGIEEWTKAAVITKGTYYPPGRNAPPGERKLYLHIEAETHEAMKAARKELKRVLQEQSVFSAPDDSSTNRYAKYSV